MVISSVFFGRLLYSSYLPNFAFFSCRHGHIKNITIKEQLSAHACGHKKPDTTQQFTSSYGVYIPAVYGGVYPPLHPHKSASVWEKCHSYKEITAVEKPRFVVGLPHPKEEKVGVSESVTDRFRHL